MLLISQRAAVAIYQSDHGFSYGVERGRWVGGGNLTLGTGARLNSLTIVTNNASSGDFDMIAGSLETSFWFNFES